MPKQTECLLNTIIANAIQRDQELYRREVDRYRARYRVLEEAVDRTHAALAEAMRNDMEHMTKVFSNRD